MKYNRLFAMLIVVALIADTFLTVRDAVATKAVVSDVDSATGSYTAWTKTVEFGTSLRSYIAWAKSIQCH